MEYEIIKPVVQWKLVFYYIIKESSYITIIIFRRIRSETSKLNPRRAIWKSNDI